MNHSLNPERKLCGPVGLRSRLWGGALALLLGLAAPALGQGIYQSYEVKDIFPGERPSRPEKLIDLNGTLIFSAMDGTIGAGDHGTELWKSDGTAQGTVMVKDIYPGYRSSISFSTGIMDLEIVNGQVFFKANDGVLGYELWKSDGTAEGTVMVRDINPGTSSSTPSCLINVNGTLFFGAKDQEHGDGLWKATAPKPERSLLRAFH